MRTRHTGYKAHLGDISDAYGDNRACLDMGADEPTVSGMLIMIPISVLGALETAYLFTLGSVSGSGTFRFTL